MFGLFTMKSRAKYAKIAAIMLAITITLTACGGGVVGDSNNYFVVKDQEVIQLSQIVIESAKLDQDALIIIYSESPILAGTPSSSIVGYTSLTKGQYQDVVIQLSSPAKNNQTFYAELWADNGTIGVLELDGIDTPISQAGTSTVSFSVNYSTQPYIEAYLNSDGQYVTSNPEQVVLKKVVVAKASWIVVYRYGNEELGEELGYQLLTAGHRSDVVITLKPNVILVDDETVVVKTYQQVGSTSRRFDATVDELITDERSQQSFQVQIQTR